MNVLHKLLRKVSIVDNLFSSYLSCMYGTCKRLEFGQGYWYRRNLSYGFAHRLMTTVSCEGTGSDRRSSRQCGGHLRSDSCTFTPCPVKFITIHAHTETHSNTVQKSRRPNVQTSTRKKPVRDPREFLYGFAKSTFSEVLPFIHETHGLRPPFIERMSER